MSLAPASIGTIMRLADRLEELIDDGVADESLAMSAAVLVAARRAARMASDRRNAATFGRALAAQIEALCVIEYERKTLLGV